MSDIFAPFEPPQSNGSAEPVTRRKPRGPRRIAAAKKANKPKTARTVNRKAAAAPAAEATASPAATPRKPRGPNKAPTGGLKLDAAVAMDAFSGLKDEDISLLRGIVGALAKVSKSSRARILGTISRIFVS